MIQSRGASGKEVLGRGTLPRFRGRGVLLVTTLLGVVTLVTPTPIWAQELDFKAIETSIFPTVFNAVFALVGITSLLGIVSGSYQYIMSEGDPKQVQAASKTITWSLIGAIIGAAAWLFVNLIWSDVIGWTSGIFFDVPPY